MFLALEFKCINSKNGFTLFELLAVIIISGVIFTIVYPRFTQSNTALLQTHNSILWMLRKSRQTAMSHGQNMQQVLIDIDKKSMISYLVSPSLKYKKELSKISLPNSIIILKGRGEIKFNALGEINGINKANIEITLADITQPKKSNHTIILTDGGYAY